MNSKEIPEGSSQFHEGGLWSAGGGNLDRPQSKMLEWGEKEKVERRKRKEEKKAKPLEVELDLSGGYSRGNMSMSSLENGKGRIWSFLAI